ncbi:MAG TPA: DUF4328 domain-containing protein [Lacipirellulaceae bacterium]
MGETDELVDGSENSPDVIPFASGHGRATAVIALFAFGIILSLVMVASDISEFQMLTRLVNHEAVTDEQIESNDNRQRLLGVTWLVWYLSTIVAFLMWVHRAHRNLPALGATGLEFTPRGAVGWYFVPIANLFKPYQCMREIYNASDPLNASDGDQSRPDRNAPVVVKTWWALFLIMGFFGNAVGRARLKADTLEAYQIVAVASVIDGVVCIVATLAAIWLVRSIDRRQNERAANLGLLPIPRFTIAESSVARF